MLDKQQLLFEIHEMAASGQLSQAEVMAALSGHASDEHSDVLKHRLSLSEIMYYIGGAIIFLGIFVLVYQNWDYFSSALRVVITLGSFIAALAVAILLNRYENLRKVSQAFFLLAGLLAPLSLNIAFKEWGMDI